MSTNGDADALKGSDGLEMVDVRLARIVIREGVDHHFIFLTEKRGKRGFPIVIGTSEAQEIRRVVTASEAPPRPLTHQLACATITALGAKIRRVDIVDLRNNTFYARLVLAKENGEEVLVDARPSDALAIALRLGAGVRVAEHVLAQVRTDKSATPNPPQAEAGDESDEADEDE